MASDPQTEYMDVTMEDGTAPSAARTPFESTFPAGFGSLNPYLNQQYAPSVTNAFLQPFSFPQGTVLSSSSSPLHSSRKSTHSASASPRAIGKARVSNRLIRKSARPLPSPSPTVSASTSSFSSAITSRTSSSPTSHDSSRYLQNMTDASSYSPPQPQSAFAWPAVSHQNNPATARFDTKPRSTPHASRDFPTTMSLNEIISNPVPYLTLLCQQRKLPPPKFQLKRLSTSFMRANRIMVAPYAADYVYGMEVRIGGMHRSTPLLYCNPKDAQQGAALLGLYLLNIPVDVQAVAKKYVYHPEPWKPAESSSTSQVTTSTIGFSVSQTTAPKSVRAPSYLSRLQTLLTQHYFIMPAFQHEHLSYYPARHQFTTRFLNHDFIAVENKKQLAKENCARKVLEFLRVHRPEVFDPAIDYRSRMHRLVLQKKLPYPKYFDPNPDQNNSTAIGIFLEGKVFIEEQGADYTPLGAKQKLCKKVCEFILDLDAAAESNAAEVRTKEETDGEKVPVIGARTHLLFEDMDQDEDGNFSSNDSEMKYEARHYYYYCIENAEDVYTANDGEELIGEEYLEPDVQDGEYGEEEYEDKVYGEEYGYEANDEEEMWCNDAYEAYEYEEGETQEEQGTLSSKEPDKGENPRSYSSLPSAEEKYNQPDQSENQSQMDMEISKVYIDSNENQK